MTQDVVGAYAATKGGILAWTRSLAIDLAEYDILVNAVAPGAIHTPFNIIDGVDISQDEGFIQKFLRERKIPLGRMGEPDEIANVIGFLSGDRCTYITGATLVADGGLTIKL
jgi:NAD(P)-dependent dehydrogenase (short-subunit alcohol dehydrogenase family)